ncbi:MAG: PglZ domain-containing protein [Bacteroidota bacterium]
MQQVKILWADDEIDLLKPHILFLEQKGFQVTPVNSGSDALEEIDHQHFDIVFLDENMPGMSGLEALNYIKATHPTTPVVMITKSEEEEIMEEAIGAKIADYLIKPLNPSQIVLSIKKILDNDRIVSEKTNLGYQKEFQQLSMRVMDAADFNDWSEVFQELVKWDLKIEETEDRSMVEVLSAQRAEAQSSFCKFIVKNYQDWLSNADTDRPLLSHNLLSAKVFPEVGEEPVFLIVIDNLRFDQWRILAPEIAKYFNIESEEIYYSILPTTTAYARNALFAGLSPREIARRHPDLWVSEEQDDGKNLKEKELLQTNLDRNHISGKMSYHKILRAEEGKQLLVNLPNLTGNAINAIVFNFVDMLSHARTDMQMIRELAPDESAYRSLTLAWFQHSSLLETLRFLSKQKVKVMITTDHGTIRVKRAKQVVGDRNTNTNLRYKVGRSLSFDEKDVFFHRDPEMIGLPKASMSSTYIFSRDDDFLAYRNNFNHYARHYKDTFQHGGISMEEVLIPFVSLRTK